MPTYEFRCPSGHEFERFYKTISAAPAELECPDCGVAAARVLSGGAGLVFKGSGFYLTDYGKNAHRKTAPDSKASGKSETGGTDGAAAKSEGSSKAEGKPKSDSAKPEAPKPTPSAKPKGE